MFDRVEMRSRCIAWDDRFMYLEQSMWKDGHCTTHILYRSAVTSKDGIVAPPRVLDALGTDIETPEIPDWVRAWTDADDLRPWPPEM